jgi:hypothetical protein
LAGSVAKIVVHTRFPVRRGEREAGHLHLAKAAMGDLCGHSRAPRGGPESSMP